MTQGVPAKVDQPIVAPNGPSAKDVIVVPATDCKPGGYDYMGNR